MSRRTQARSYNFSSVTLRSTNIMSHISSSESRRNAMNFARSVRSSTAIRVSSSAMWHAKFSKVSRCTNCKITQTCNLMRTLLGESRFHMTKRLASERTSAYLFRTIGTCLCISNDTGCYLRKTDVSNKTYCGKNKAIVVLPAIATENTQQQNTKQTHEVIQMLIFGALVVCRASRHQPVAENLVDQ